MNKLPFSPSYRRFLGSLCAPLVGLLGLVAPLPMYAQSGATPNPADLLPPKFIPKSPTVAEFQRFDNQLLVNLPTGAAQLSIPLAEVSAGSLRLPVSLAYSYTGLQVYQPRDLVGLGWSLQAGATITRQINGLLDDFLATVPTQRYNPDSVEAGSSSQRYLKQAFQNHVDTGPDIYSFFLPNGASGRFIIIDTTITLFPQQPVRIRRISGVPYGTGFQISTDEGIRYQFQAVEITNPNPSNHGPIGEHASAWHLSKVISADNSDTLRLHYSHYDFEPMPRRSSLTTGQYFTGSFYEATNYINQNGPGYECGSTASYSFHNAQSFDSRVKAQYLDSITSRDTRLLLARTDRGHELYRARLLATSGGRREIKRFTLYQSHFEGDTLTDYRLRLDSVRESANGTRLPAYRFRYSDYNRLPSRGSAAQDYWGYFNGVFSNGDYNTLSNPTMLADPRLNQGQRRAANREPNYSAAAAGSLQQVFYPTGGNSRWEYEPGRLAAPAGDIPVDSLSVLLGTSYNPANTIPIPDPDNYRRMTATGIVAFQVPQAADVVVHLGRQPTGTTGGASNNTYRDFNLWRRLPTGDTLVTNSTAFGAYMSFDPALGKKFVFRLAPGTYAVQVYCEARESNTSVYIRIPYRDSTKVKLGLPGPGIRVLRTTTTAAGSPNLTRTYRYQLNGYSSGMSLLANYGKGFDKYQFKKILKRIMNAFGAQIETITECQFINTSSDNQKPGDEFNKYNFFYSCVTEEKGPDQGITVNFFTQLHHQFHDVVPVKQQIYRQDQRQPGARQLIQQTRYAYVTDTIREYPLLRVRKSVEQTALASTAIVFLEPEEYSAEKYYLHTGFITPSVTEHFQYDEQGNALTTNTRLTYQRQRLVRSTTRTSTGYTIQRFKRLSDYLPLPAVTALRVNGFNPVIEAQTWYRPLNRPDSVLTAGRITLYNPTYRSPASTYSLRLAAPLPGPDQEVNTGAGYTSLLSDSRYELTGTARYAPPGDLIQSQPVSGPPTSYLWGYARTQLIAEVKNAPYVQLAATSFEPDATGRWRYDSTATSPYRVAGGFTGRWAYQLVSGSRPNQVSRAGLPAGAYELSYWAQGSGPTVFQNGAVATAPLVTATAPGGWRRYQTRLNLTGISNDVNLLAPTGGAPVLLDELRLSPVGSQLTTYTHDPLVGMTSQTYPTGRTSTYEYDALGRLVRARDEQGRVLSQQQYHYAKP